MSAEILAFNPKEVKDFKYGQMVRIRWDGSPWDGILCRIASRRSSIYVGGEKVRGYKVQLLAGGAWNVEKGHKFIVERALQPAFSPDPDEPLAA